MTKGSSPHSRRFFFAKNANSVTVTSVLLLFVIITVATEANIIRQDSAAGGSGVINAPWAFQNQNQQNTGFSPQTIINVSNVGTLKPAWKTYLPGVAGTPVVWNGIVYVTGFGGKGTHCVATLCATLYAINETTGVPVWVDGPANQTGLQFRTRAGVTIDNGNIFAGTTDNQLVSVNARTGAVNWNVSIVNGLSGSLVPYNGPEATPLVYNGKVIIGENEGDASPPAVAGARGVVQAFSELNGARLWAFYTMPPSPINSTNQGFYKNTWSTNGTTGCMCGGGDVWNVPAVDPHTGIIYFGTGNPSPVDESSIIGPNFTDLYTDSIIALNSSNGQMKWAYQVIPGSYLDHDNGMPVQLFNTTINGVQTEVVGDGGKAGYYVELNAVTGALIFKFAAGIHQNENANATSSPTVVYPGDNGGINTFSSYNPLTNMIYTIGSNRGNTCTLNMTSGFIKCPGLPMPANSTLYAINASTGLVVWTFNMTGSSSGLPGGWATGASSTNYLVFTGDGNHHYYALDARNGQILWNYTQPLGNNKGPYWSWGPPSITDGAVFETTLGNTTTGVLEAFAPSGASSTPTVVQTASGSGSPVTSVTVSFPSSVTSGDVIVVGVTYNQNSNITSLTDSLHNTYAKDINQIAQGAYQGIWVTTAKSTGSDSVNVTVSSFGAIYVNLYELSGTVLRFSTSSGSGTGTILSVTPFTPPAGSFVVSEVFGGGGSLSPSTGFTCLGCGAATTWLGQSSYATNWGGSSTTVPWTTALSNTWGEVAAIFEPAITTTTAYTSSSSSTTTYTTTTTTSTSTSTSHTTQSSSSSSSTTSSSLTTTSVIVIPRNTPNNSGTNNVLGLLPTAAAAVVVASVSAIFALRKRT